MHDSFDCPKVVPASDLSAFNFLCAFEISVFMCGVNVRWGSRVTPRIFGFLLTGMCSL